MARGDGSRRKSYFAKELRPMMYGFGDVENPRPDSVELLEDLVIDYITDIVCKAVKVSQATSIGSLPALPNPVIRLRCDDIMHVLRHDGKKVARIEELLYMNEELKRARKAFDIEEEMTGNPSNH